MKSLGDRHTSPHAQAGVYHVKRLCVSECIASDVAAEYGLLSLHRLLHRIEGGTVRASRTEDRRTDRELGHLVCLCRL